ncbi:MAG: prephenate dehydrogenase/arogenate dehydrogenase family protein [Pseudomonadales bacterium]|nr:prephenate dehydrogenase/arogenate dehydrogenase family protein [Pseudomonadales bacterium]
MNLTFDKPRVAVIGLGLIGGSIAIGLRSLGCVVQGFDEDKKSLEAGLANGVIDGAATSIASLVASFKENDSLEKTNLLIIAVPVLAMEMVFKEISPVFNSKKIVITDVGSVKAEVVRALESTAGEMPTNFVLGHPIAGSERHGVHASNGALFQHHQVILTPGQNTQADCIAYVRAMWEQLGASVTEMDVAHHDDILAQTSHLPHLLAYALIDTLSKQGDSLEIFDYAAGGLRDFSRIAASDPVMWRDIFESNRKPLLNVLDRYLDELTELRGLIEAGESGLVFVLLERAKKARDHFSILLEKRSK